MSQKVGLSGRGRSHTQNTLDFSDPLSSFILVYEILNAKRLNSIKSWLRRLTYIYIQKRIPAT